MMEILIQQIQTNDFFSGGFLLMILGTGLAYSKQIVFNTVVPFLKRRFITTIDVSDEDELFSWMQSWLNQHPHIKKTILLTATTSSNIKAKRGSGNTANGRDDNDDNEENNYKKPSIFLTPAPGRHIFKFKDKWFLLKRDRTNTENSESWLYRETFTLSTYGKNRDIVLSLFEEARDLALPNDDPKTQVFYNRDAWWETESRQTRRELSSVILPESIKSDIVNDLSLFIKEEDWYKNKGIPYRRGYLLYGAPGNGKTSLIKALAAEFGFSVCALTLSDLSTGKSGSLRQLLAEMPKRSILLLEDIDCAFAKRNKKDTMATFSTVLNALDGVGSSEGRIMFMTTNHIEKLDSALIRPGRVDKKYLIPYATKEQAEELCKRFYSNVKKELVERFVLNFPEEKVSMATLQGHFLIHRSEPQKALEHDWNE